MSIGSFIADAIKAGLPRYAKDSSGNVTGLVGPTGDIPLFSNMSMALLGDSITGRNLDSIQYSFEGYFVSANVLMGQKYNLLWIESHSGYTIEQLGAYVATIIASGAKNCIVLAGTNNASDADATTIVGKLRTYLWRPLLNAGVTVIAATIPPNAGWTGSQSGKMAQVNYAIRQEPFTTTNMKVVDLWRAWVGSSSGAPLTGYSDDGVHPNSTGGMAFGREIAAVLGGVSALTPTLSSGGVFDPLTLTPNPLAIGANTTGTNKFLAGTGVTGTGPHSWGVNRSGTSTAVCTGNGARSDYISGNVLSIACSFAGDGEYIYVTPAPSGTDIYLARAWAGGVAKSFGELTTPSAGRSGFQYKCITSPGGTTHASVQPTWPTTIGATVTDNDINWLCIADVAANDKFVYEAELTISALSGQIGLSLISTFEDSGYSGTLRPSLLLNGVVTNSISNRIYSPNSITPGTYWTNVPLNTLLTLRSQIILAPSTGTVVHVSPTMRIFGKTGSTATVNIQRLEMRRIPTL